MRQISVRTIIGVLRRSNVKWFSPSFLLFFFLPCRFFSVSSSWSFVKLGWKVLKMKRSKGVTVDRSWKLRRVNENLRRPLMERSRSLISMGLEYERTRDWSPFHSEIMTRCHQYSLSTTAVRYISFDLTSCTITLCVSFQRYKNHYSDLQPTMYDRIRT